VRSAVLLALLGTLAAAARLFAHLQTDLLWFHELGQERVFWTSLTARWLVSTAIGLATALLLLANFWVVERTARRVPAGMAPPARARQALRAGYLAVSVGAGLIAGSVVGLRHWEQILLWLHKQEFGVADPVFHRDVGFFVFTLPVYELLAGWLLAVGVLALAMAAAGHLANGAIRTQRRPIAATRRAGAHLLVLGALLLIVSAWKHGLSAFALELPREDAGLPAGYTDLHVQLIWLRVLVIVSVVGAGALLVSAVQRWWMLPAAVVVVMAFAELAGPGPVSGLVQQYVVEPQTLARERPYIARQIRFTQLAYGLDDVEERSLPAAAAISDRELRSHRNVLKNIQLWDPSVLNGEIDEHQSIGSFYSFPNITVDRYREGGRNRGMILSERQLDIARLEPSGRTWANDRLAYTHGYGLVAVPSGEVDADGGPTFSNSEFAAGTSATRVSQPRLYYGVQPRGAAPWVIARSRREEVEKPLSDSAAKPDRHYDGGGGIPLAGPLRRAAFALRFGDMKLLISKTLQDRSRLILHRDVRDRVRTLAPFLTWDERPQVAVIGGRISFLLAGYTTSSSYPYSKRIEVRGQDINYMRAAALAAVDAYSGRVTIYASGADPLLRAWQGVYPTLFTPESQMPADLREHLRYPEELFKAQADVWATFHADDVQDFYTRVDDWQQPADLSGSLDRVGSIRFRPPTERPLDDSGPQDDSVRAPRMRPSYVLARLPGERNERFMLTTPFTPHGQENLTGYLAGFIHADGGPRLTQLTLPRPQLALGPAQVTRRILATPAVGDRLRLLNAETTDLGDQAVAAVQLSEMRVVPIGDSFLYVLPIYGTAAGSGVIRLRLVTVYLNGHVGYGRNLDEAIERARDAAAGPGRGGDVAVPRP
jgi:uncharacterized membrane protein (UPF0182 family)